MTVHRYSVILHAVGLRMEPFCLYAEPDPNRPARREAARRRQPDHHAARAKRPRVGRPAGGHRPVRPRLALPRRARRVPLRAAVKRRLFTAPRCEQESAARTSARCRRCYGARWPTVRSSGGRGTDAARLCLARAPSPLALACVRWRRRHPSLSRQACYLSRSLRLADSDDGVHCYRSLTPLAHHPSRACGEVYLITKTSQGR